MRKVVGLAGFEPAASSSRTKRSTKLSHSPFTEGAAQYGRADRGSSERFSLIFARGHMMTEEAPIFGNGGPERVDLP